MADADAVALLRAILVEDEAAYDRQVAALNATGWDDAAGLIAAAFLEGCERRFGFEPDPGAVVQFVADARDAYEPDDLDPATAEALIWATFGDDERAGEVEPDAIIPTEIILIHRLVSEQAMSPAQIDEFLASAAQLADDAR